ncbi:Membrane carboxypeptidase (penicillin-binding protein) [Nonomuraea solani]|uniref:Membrane carboxypeptidase (Penicillin-binding protein) n=1 Tax=Nonomuraea solani TaxID=1144553 RepID=A0A1H6CZW8_9ACTN|nr:transglycosylase domain-containing protein [Nonomuraea solani]SEG78572.1 Membrane carboxypeptidase (penicillin-binding protein) [Nonomuraea solani]
MSNQETMVSDAPPRRSRRRNQGGEPPEPPGPPTKKDGGGRGGWRRFVPSWKIVVAGAVVLAAGLFGMVMVAYANTPVPTSAQDEALAQQSTIYFRDGKKIAQLGFKREIVPIEAMSQNVRDAAVAIENKTFYEDSGISISGMFRSVWMTASGQQIQGASTITQQMARNYYDGLSQEVSIKRKVMEIFVAVKLDDELTKDQILANYLNTINFGRAFGVQAAAKAYFGSKVNAKNLTPEQGAYLAARIQQPNWDHDSPELQARFKTVVQYMAEQWPDRYGSLPQTAKFPKTRKTIGPNEMSGIKGYMVKEVLNELAARGLTEEKIRSGGYHITSTFDYKLMKAAQKAVKETRAAYNMSTEFHAGLAAVDPKRGRVLAFYGGDDYVTDPWNEPFQSTKQAASAFKPYVLAAWLQAGYSLKSFVPGNQTVPKELPGQQEGGITNSHNVGAAVDVVKATAQSVNTAYVSMAYALPNKLDDVKNLVEAAGFNQKRMEDDVRDHHYQFAIGSALVTPVEQAAGYAIFANGGKYTKYHVVKQVKLKNQVVYGEQLSSKNVIDPGVAADATVAMEAVLTNGTAQGKGLGNRRAAGKTGTNNNEKEAWFVGYTPQISTAVGFYREQCATKTGKIIPPEHSNCPVYKKGSKKFGPNNPYTTVKEMPLGFEGAGPPTIAWQKFMQMAHEGLPVEEFPDRAEVGIAENIVPSPTPTPTPTPDAGENPFDDQNPIDDPNANEDCLIGCGGEETTPDDDGVTIDDGEGDAPQTADDSGVAGGSGGSGGGSMPESRFGRPDSMTTRPEDR